MKPLELTVYPPIPPMPIGKWEIQERVMWWQDRADEMDAGESKRLTDAELAAEYHNMDSDCQIAWIDGEHTEAMQERFETLERFATLPHYDEASL